MGTFQRLISSLLIISALWALSTSTSLANSCLRDALLLNLKILENNHFNTGRNFRHYDAYFGWDFRGIIRSLPPEAHWVDAGAGSAGAMSEAMLYPDHQIRVRNLTAIAFEKPNQVRTNFGDAKFRYLDKRYIENIPAEEIGKADIITDLYGPFAYTQQIDRVLTKYMQVLKKDASAFIYFRPNGTTVNQSAEGLGKYLDSIKGAKIKWHRPKASGEIAFQLTKISDDFEVPPLILEGFNHEAKSALGDPLPDPNRWYRH